MIHTGAPVWLRIEIIEIIVVIEIEILRIERLRIWSSELKIEILKNWKPKIADWELKNWELRILNSGLQYWKILNIEVFFCNPSLNIEVLPQYWGCGLNIEGIIENLKPQTLHPKL